MVKVGLAGWGFMGGTHAQCHAALPNAKLVAGADVDEERRLKFAKMYNIPMYASVDEMLAYGEVDMVDVCVPTYLHREVVEKVAAAGKHVLCEKPMALTVEDCEAMIAATQKADVKMMIGQVLRFWPEYVVVKEILDSGRLGKIKFATATRTCTPPTWGWQDWLHDWTKSGCAAVDLHIHDADTLQWMLGKPTRVSALGARDTRHANADLNGLVSIFTRLEHPNEAVSHALGSWDLPAGSDGTPPLVMGLEIYCAGGTIRLEMGPGREHALTVYPAGGTVEYPHVPAIEVPTVAGGTAGNISALGGYFVEVKYFVDCVDNDEEPDRVPLSEAKNAVAIVRAAEASHNQNGAPRHLSFS